MGNSGKLRPLARIQEMSLQCYTDDLAFYSSQSGQSELVIEIGAGIGRVTSFLWESGFRSLLAIEPEKELQATLVRRMRSMGHPGRLIIEDIPRVDRPFTVIMPCNLLALVCESEVRRLLRMALSSDYSKLAFDVDVAKRNPSLAEVGGISRCDGPYRLIEESTKEPRSQSFKIRQTLMHRDELVAENVFPVYYRPLDFYLEILRESGRRFRLFHGFDGTTATGLDDPSVRRVSAVVYPVE